MSSHDTDLFAPAVKQVAPPGPADATVDPVSLLTPEQALASVDLEPLPEVIDALKRIPEAARASFERAAARMFKSRFLKDAAERIARPGAAHDPSQSLTMVAHSVKVAVYSAIQSASFAPWHLADAKVVARIAADVDKGVDMDRATKHLDAVKPVHLFVAALEADDRESYLKAAANLVKRHKVRAIVLDAELIEWFPEADFLAAAEQIGIHPQLIGIADQATASRHSIMTQQGRVEVLPAIYVNSLGKQLSLDDQGGVQLEARPEPAPAHAPRKPTAAAHSTTAPVSDMLPVAPGSAIQSRIQALRATQSRRGAARP